MTINLPTMQLATNPASGATPVGTFQDKALRYRRSIANIGGDNDASWYFPIDHTKGLNEKALRWWYERCLGYRYKERTNSLSTWQGIIWSMELTLDGKTQRIEMDQIANRVRCDYTNTNGQKKSTSWYTNDASIAHFGQIDYIVLGRYMTDSEAQDSAQQWLNLYAWPRPIPIKFKRDATPGLEVQAVGDDYTATFRYLSEATLASSPATISDYITTIVTNDCEFLEPTAIQSNARSFSKHFDKPIRAREALTTLAGFGDDDKNPWRYHVMPEGKVVYEPLDNTPVYYWYGSKKGYADAFAGEKGWTARPAVLRDMTAPRGNPPPGTFLLDARDTWIEEIEHGHGMEEPNLSPTALDPTEILRRQEQYSEWMNREDHYARS